METNLIDVSLFASAIHPEHWMEIYENIKSTNSVTFEIVFVGPIEPTFALPGNFKYIKTNVKPTQCFEIAARTSVGKALLQTADDIDYSPGAVDKMFAAYSVDPKHIMSSCYYFRGTSDKRAEQHFWGALQSQDRWPFLPVCGMYDRELHYELGGADKRFHAVQWELDMYMRLWAHGVQTVFVDATCTENMNWTSNMFGKNWQDRHTVVDLWPNMQRKDAVQSFSNENILTVEQ